MARVTVRQMAEHLADEMAFDDIEISALTVLDYLAICGYTLTPDKSGKSAQTYAEMIAEGMKANA